MPGPRTVRYLGLAASVLLAIAAGLGGARPDGDVAGTPLSIAAGPHGPIVLLGWLAGTLLQGYAWWTLRDRVPSARWAVGTAVLWLLPFLVVPPVGSRDVYSYACQGDLYTHGLSPYVFGANTLPCPWVEAVSPIWRDTPAPYGPLFVLVAAVAVLAGGSLLAVIGLLRLAAVAGVAVIGAGLPVIAARCGVPAGRALWLALAGPLVGAHLIGGPHNDALMLAFVVAGLAVAAKGRWPVAAGLLLGLAVAVKITAIVVVPFAVLLVVPRIRAGAALTGAAAVAMGAVTAVSGLGFGWTAGFAHTQDLIQFTSLPTAVGMSLTYAGILIDPSWDAVPAVRLIALLLLAALLVILWWRAAADTRDPVRAALRGAALAFAAMIALAPSFHPWYLLGPLVLLAATTTRTAWVVALTPIAALLVLPDGSGLARYAKFPGAPLVTILLIVLLVRYVRSGRKLTAIAPTVTGYEAISDRDPAERPGRPARTPGPDPVDATTAGRQARRLARRPS